jgi:hypothetical protein
MMLLALLRFRSRNAKWVVKKHPELVEYTKQNKEHFDLDAETWSLLNRHGVLDWPDAETVR